MSLHAENSIKDYTSITFILLVFFLTYTVWHRARSQGEKKKAFSPPLYDHSLLNFLATFSHHYRTLFTLNGMSVGRFYVIDKTGLKNSKKRTMINLSAASSFMRGGITVNAWFHAVNKYSG